MVLMRCAWHRQYFGYPTVYGVRSWRGAKFLFAEGRCRGCAERRRAESQGDVGPAAPLIPPGLPRVALSLALVSALLLVARPVNNPERQAAPAPSALPGAATPLRAAPSQVGDVAAPAPPPPALVPRAPSAPVPVVRPPATVGRARATMPLHPRTAERAAARESAGSERWSRYTRGTFLVLSDPAMPPASGGVPVRLDSGCADRLPERTAAAPSCWTGGPTATLPVHVPPGVQAP